MIKILISITLCFIITYGYSQQKNIPYDFPLKPGMEEWAKFKSGKEMAEACNIPGPILSSLTTEALVKTCLNYPLLHEVFFANNVQKGFEGLTKNFNGLSELLERKDAGQELLKIYKEKKVNDLDESSSEEKQGLFTFEFIYLELMLSQPQILDDLDSNEKVAVAKEAILKYTAKNEKKDVFGTFGLTVSAFLMANILQAENKLTEVLKTVEEKELQIFLHTTMYSNSSTVSAIFNTTKTLWP